MITIPLSTEELTKERLAASPLWETVTSFGVLLQHGRDTVHAPWARRAAGPSWHGFLPPARRDVPGEALPGFPQPSPDASVASFEEELERVRATPTEDWMLPTSGLKPLTPAHYE